MASDEGYASFLDKANQPTGASRTSTSKSTHQNQQQDLTSQSSNTPSVLKSLDVTFTSESDEPFEPFTVAYSGSSLPSALEFAKAIKQDKDSVEEVSVGEFDPRGEYGDVVEAVKKAAGRTREVRCFTAEGGKSRVFYYVVGLDEENRLVGVRAVSVES